MRDLNVMWRHRVPFAALGMVGAIAVLGSGCASSKSASEARFVQQAHEICLFTRRRHIPVSAATRKWQLRYLEYEVALTRTEINKLAEVQAPPDQQALFRDLVVRMRAENVIAAAAARRFAHGDAGAEPSSLKARYDLYRRAREAAIKLGLTGCP